MSEPDRPQIIVFPPLVVVATLALGGALQWLIPLGVLAGLDQTGRIVAGTIVLAAGILVTVNGRLSLMRRGTNVNPLRPATALVTEGIYRWTRNPMYVGVLTALIGLALIFAIDWLPLVMLPSVLLLHFGIVMREERYLDRKFGDAYRGYKLRVPRYLRLI